MHRSAPLFAHWINIYLKRKFLPFAINPSRDFLRVDIIFREGKFYKAILFVPKMPKRLYCVPAQLKPIVYRIFRFEIMRSNIFPRVAIAKQFNRQKVCRLSNFYVENFGM